MRLGYNTNGLAHHDLQSALRLLAQIGYTSVALTLDHCLLNPWSADLPAQLRAVRTFLRDHDMQSVIETGARFLLDPLHKHEPTLVTADPQARRRRIDFLRRAIDIAVELESDAVSLWSGVLRDAAAPEAAWQRLIEGLAPVREHAEQADMNLAFEPEPGMLIDTMPRFADLLAELNSPRLRLTLDVGHLHCLGETPIADVIRRWHEPLVNVHIEDMRAGVHEHLMFGEGDMEFPPIIQALAEVQYSGGIHVELSRHSHQGPEAAQAAFDFLQPLVVAAHA